MATWNHGDKTAGSTVQFNGKSYVTRKDTGQTVYDTVAAVAGDPGLGKEIEDIRKQLAGVSTGTGAGFGEVQFAGPDNTTYYYRKIEGDISKTVREEFETGVLAMTDGSKPSAAILLINCVNLNDSTFADKNQSRAQVMYKSPASEFATPACYINSRGGTTATFGTGSFITGRYTGDGVGVDQYKNVTTARQNIDLGFQPFKVEIYSNEMLQTATGNFGSMDVSTHNPIWTITTNSKIVGPGLAGSLTITDNGFQVGASYTITSGGYKSSKTDWHFGPNTKDVEYTYIAYAESGTTVSQSTDQVSSGTYGPGTQAIVPVHADGKAKLIAHINKLAAGQVPKECFLEMWVVGVMGGGGSVPDNNYANLLKRVETLESTSGSSGNQATGFYTGTSLNSSITINLGFRPKILHLVEGADSVTLYEDSAGYLTGNLTYARPNSSSGLSSLANSSSIVVVHKLGYYENWPRTGDRIINANENWTEAAFKFTDTGFEISTSRPSGMGHKLNRPQNAERPYFGTKSGMYIAAG